MFAGYGIKPFKSRSASFPKVKLSTPSKEKSVTPRPEVQSIAKSSFASRSSGNIVGSANKENNPFASGSRNVVSASKPVVQVVQSLVSLGAAGPNVQNFNDRSIVFAKNALAAGSFATTIPAQVKAASMQPSPIQSSLSPALSATFNLAPCELNFDSDEMPNKSTSAAQASQSGVQALPKSIAALKAATSPEPTVQFSSSVSVINISGDGKHFGDSDLHNSYKDVGCNAMLGAGQSHKASRILEIVLLVFGIAALIIGIGAAIAAAILLSGGTLPAVFTFIGIKLALGIGIAGTVAGLASTIAGGILLSRAIYQQGLQISC